jgi:putative thiamine transport system ATP-binding protein
LFAFGVGAAVSLAQYLPTLLFGGGGSSPSPRRRWPSAAASTGGWRGSTACCNCCCPFIYALALWLPAHQPRPEALTRCCTPPHSPSSSTAPPADAPPQGGPGRGAHPDGTERLWQELLPAALAGLPPGAHPADRGHPARHTSLHPLPPGEGVGILFQDDLLFAHLTVAENLMFGMPAHLKDGCKADPGPRGAGRGRAEGSGGQAARGALRRPESPRQPAACLLAEPRALPPDEPFSRLDKPLRAAFRTLVFERRARRPSPPCW